MLDDTISLVDGATTYVFDRIKALSPSKTKFVEKTLQTPTSDFALIVGATEPKTNGDSLGVLRPESKIRIGVTVKNAAGMDVVQPLIYTISGSVPVGTSTTDEARARKILGLWLAHANFSDLVYYQEI